MKKNFLKVTALLIAAMLMVVSCTQEVAPVDNGLVDASVNITDTRALKTSGEEFGDITYKYKLTALFGQIDTNSDIVGNMNDYDTIPSTKKLGYVTQGLWQIEVQGIDAKNKVVLYGKANHYFNNQNAVAYVFVDPITGTEKGKLDIDVKMQDLEETPGTKYVMKYSLTALNGTQTVSPTVISSINKDADLNNVSVYSVDKDSIEAGYYRLTLSVWEKDGATPIGGVTKSIRVLEGRTVTVTGSIEPKDFDKSDVSVINIEPKGTLTFTSTNTSNKVEMDFKVELDSTITTTLSSAGYTLASSEDAFNTATGMVYLVSYVWNVDGSAPTGDTTLRVTYDVPGPKSVACAIIIKVKSFGEKYTYMSAGTDSLVKNFVVNESFGVNEFPATTTV